MVARRGRGWGSGKGALGALLGLFSVSTAYAAEAPAAAPDVSPTGKVLNRTLFSPPEGMEAGEQIFLTNDMRKPLAGTCEKVPAHQPYVEEMLVNIDSIGSPGGKTYQRRVALVVGNGAYEAMRDLANPKNDATSMAKLMHLLGFDVFYAADVKAAALESCLSKFKADLEAKPADVALFYYAGHGVQLTQASDGEKRNYMMSVDARVDAAGKGYGFKQIDAALDEMRKHSKQSVFLYDACRNSPLAEGAVKEADGKSVRQADLDGAAPVEVKSTDTSSAPQLFIAYATSPGKTADDAWGQEGSQHSPFTQALLEHLPEPGATIDQALALAFNKVGERTGWKQTPWINTSLTSRLRFNGDLAAREFQTRVSDHAAKSAQYREQGLRGKAIAEALKGLPHRWVSGPEASSHGAARAELYRAYDDRNVHLINHQFGFDDAAFVENDRNILSHSIVDIRLWDSETGELLRVFDCCDDGSWPFALSAGRRMVAMATSPIVNRDKIKGTIWNMASGKLTGLSLSAPIRDGFFSPSGDLLAAQQSSAESEVLSIWDSESGTELCQVRGFFVGGAFSPQSSLLVLSKGPMEQPPRISIYDARNCNRIRDIYADEIADSLAFSIEGVEIAVALREGGIRIHGVADGALLKTLSNRDYRGRIAFSPDGKLLGVNSRSEASVWDLKSGHVLRTIEVLGTLNSNAFSSQSDRFVAAGQIAIVTDVQDRNILSRLTGDPEREGVFVPVFALANGHMVFASFERKAGKNFLNFLDLQTSGRNRIEVDEFVGSLTISPQGDLAASISGEHLTVWNTFTGKALWNISSKWKYDSDDAAFSPDGEQLLVAPGFNGTTLRVAKSGAEIWTRKETAERLAAAATFSADGREIYLPGLFGTDVLETKSGELLRTISENGAETIRTSSDGKYVATASNDDTIEIRSAADWKLIAVLKGHIARIDTFQFLERGLLILTGSQDGTVKLWDPETGRNLNSWRSRGVTGDVSGSEIALLPDDDGDLEIRNVGLYGPALLSAAYNLLSDKLRSEVERERIRYWGIDPELID